MPKPRLYTEGDILEDWILVVTSLHRRSFKAWLVLAANHKWFMEHERIQRELLGHSSIVGQGPSLPTEGLHYSPREPHGMRRMERTVNGRP